MVFSGVLGQGQGDDQRGADKKTVFVEKHIESHAVISSPFLIISLVWHGFWLLVVSPVMPVDGRTRVTGQIFSLGRILRQGDLNVLDRPVTGRKSLPRAHEFFLARPLSSLREQSELQKPQETSLVQGVRLSLPVGQIDRVPGQSRISFERSDRISIVASLSDVGEHLGQIDLSDLKPLVKRRYLSSHMTLKLLVSEKGRIQMVQKVVGCGDPSLDLYVMMKLKGALVRFWPVKKDSVSWVNFRLNLEDRDGN